jgi:hypothetical protein
VSKKYRNYKRLPVRYSVTQLGGACPESGNSVAQAASTSLIRALLKPDAAIISRRQTMGTFKKTSYMASLSLFTAVLFLASPKPVFGKDGNPGKDKKASSTEKSHSPPGLENFKLPDQLPDKAREHLPELPEQVPEKLRDAFRDAASPSQ